VTIGEGIAVAALLVLVLFVIRGVRGPRRPVDGDHENGWASASGEESSAD
jgi:hypothetical protein